MKLSKTRIQQLKKLCQKIKVNFQDLTLLDLAMTHRSYVNENKNKNQKDQHNERLEFLGDAVLELSVTEYLYDKYPNRPEGDLTSFRAAVVCTTSLAEISTKLQLGEYLKMSNGEELTGGRTKKYLLANTYEALLGAIYHEYNYKQANSFVLRTVTPKLARIVKLRLDINSKTKLQELTQTLFNTIPQYTVLNREGPAHNRVFTMGIFIKGELYGTGRGGSKQEGEEIAAKQALKKIKQNKLNRVA